MGHILLIDDDVKIGQLLSSYFKQFDLTLEVAHSPSEGFAKIEQDRPDLLVLDVMLPEMDGFEVCRQIRQQPERFGKLPIVMLTARGDVTDRIVGLELGADDYLPKPFEPRELIVRVQSVMRRSHDDNQNEQTNKHAQNYLIADGLALDLAKQTTTLDAKELELTTMEYELLKAFMLSSGKTYNRDELMNALRGIDAELFSRAVDTLVSRLRHKLGDTSKAPRFIKTIWGRGYAFIPPVSKSKTLPTATGSQL